MASENDDIDTMRELTYINRGQKDPPHFQIKNEERYDLNLSCETKFPTHSPSHYCKPRSPPGKNAIVHYTSSDESLKPYYADEGSSGADLRADIKENIIIGVGQFSCVPTGIKVVIPDGFEVQIRPRSGLAFRNGITVLNSPGTIDSSYRGEIKVILINHGNAPFVVEPKMRIAQAVCAPVTKMNFVHVSDETYQEKFQTSRGEGGFGSTGLS